MSIGSSQLFDDQFDRADSALTLGGAYAVGAINESAVAFGIASGVAHVMSGEGTPLRWGALVDAPSHSPNYYVDTGIVQTGSGLMIGVLLRFDPDGSDSSGYFLGKYGAGAVISRYDAGVESELIEYQYIAAWESEGPLFHLRFGAETNESGNVVLTISDAATPEGPYTQRATITDESENRIVTAGTAAIACAFNVGTAGTSIGWDYLRVVGEPGGATISSPTPTGTIGTTTSATVGCTTDTEEGDLYVVLSETDNVSTATDEQIAAGQNSSSTAADFADDAEIEDDSPSVPFTEVLDPDTTYYYAMVQETEEGYSNVLSGSFKTAAAAVVATKLLFSAQPGNTVVGQTMSAVQVQAVNGSDALDTSFDDNVTIALQTGDGPFLGTLTKAAVGGLATFDDLVPRTLNEDAVLRATADGLTQVDSNTFDVTAGTGDGTAGFPASSRLGGLLQ